MFSISLNPEKKDLKLIENLASEILHNVIKTNMFSTHFYFYCDIKSKFIHYSFSCFWKSGIPSKANGITIFIMIKVTQ